MAALFVLPGFPSARRLIAPSSAARKGGVTPHLLAYHVPQYMPGALPFAMDGGGGFYLFDLRADAIDGEYPIFFAHAGNLGWDDAVPVAQTFPDACRGNTNP